MRGASVSERVSRPGWKYAKTGGDTSRSLGESSSVSVIPYKLIGGLQQWAERLCDIRQRRCEFTELVDESHERSQIGAVRWHLEVVDGCNLVVIDSETLFSDMESTEIHFSHTELELLRADGDAVLPITYIFKTCRTCST